ncbi:hypothetical protein KS4_01380 [Poriferisphaera corsica]|uniref:Uncharacterized protein n=1 Tax=Poriferisphaera corsica TaxID=2528020 RepID=A0A517YPG1_9BACT|nr:hypothetical protein [Poriferisphaera corsica]QDU32109.1 hypothetical protein KS4_01380 [Poriferisphaera corsica]
MNVPCPNCDNTLIAPPEVVGCKVKCTLCEHVFIAPSPVNDLNDDTFSSWLEEDYEETVREEVAFHEEHEKKLLDMKSLKKDSKTDADSKSTKKRYIKFKSTSTASTKAPPQSTSLLENTNIDDIEITVIDEEAERKKRRDARFKKHQLRQQQPVHSSRIPEKCLNQICIWANLKTDESVREYLIDTDITPAESGSAGIIFTNHRLIYRKYHHNGHISFDDADATINAKLDTGSYTLSLFKGSTRSRMVRLSSENLDQLKALLKSTSIKLKIKSS